MRRPISPLSLLLFATTSYVWSQPNTIVISQIYGGGGNTSAPYSSDFVELLNRGTSPVTINAWTIQYASSAGSSWDKTELAGIIQPGQYYLIKLHSGDVGTLIPTADATGDINLSASTGKIALVSNNTLLTGTSPIAAALVDFVGYGNANASKGSPAPALSNTTAALRKASGCTDTGNNSADFTEGNPHPRNRLSPTNTCSPVSTTPAISSGGIVNAANYSGGGVAPGEIVTIFGSNLGPANIQTLQLAPGGASVATLLGGTRVLFNGIAAPLVYALDTQVSAVVPYFVSTLNTVDVRVEYDGRSSPNVLVAVKPVLPGIFTADSSGKGQGAIQNQDYRINGPTRAAARGSVITIYGTGGGSTDPLAGDGAVVGLPLPYLRGSVSVQIGSLSAEVLYAGMAPSLVNGVLQINARVPGGLLIGGALPLEVKIDGVASQAGVTVYIDGPMNALPGTGPMIEQRLQELATIAGVPFLPEVPQDRIGLPPDWLGVVSWNIQVGGTSTTAGALRPPMVQSALGAIFGGTFQILAAQEIPNSESAALLTTLLPGGIPNWKASFIDSTDSMDNGFWFRNSVVLRDAFLLNVVDQIQSGDVVTNPALSLHPPQVAQFESGNFDFTLITIHLTFAEGNTAESAREMRLILDYLDWYFNQPDHDPDVIICGDYNIPSRLSGQKGRNGLTLDDVIQDDSRFLDGERRFVVLVHEPTSRSSLANGGLPANNYDHCVVSADVLEELIVARRIDPTLLTDHQDDPEHRLTSDHFPIVAFFRTNGSPASLDRGLALRRPLVD